MVPGRGLRPFAAPLAVAVAASVVLAFVQHGRGENPWGNAGFQQIQNSLSVVAGKGFGRSYDDFPFAPGLFLRPVYTLVLVPFAAVFAWNGLAFRLALAAFQGALNAGTGALAGDVLVRAGRPDAARLALWACVLDPFLVAQASTVVDTAAFTLLLVAAWAAGVRAAERRTTGAWALAGVVLGLAVLTRSTATAVVPALLLRLRDARPPLGVAVRWAGACAAAAFLVLVPWFLRNHALTDRWMLSTVDGVNVWMGNNDHTAAFLDAERSLDELPGRPAYDSLAWRTIPEQLASYDGARAAAEAWMREHPGDAARLAVRKAGHLWTPSVFPRSTRSTLHELKDRVSTVVASVVYVLALIGAVAAWRAATTRRVARDVLVVCAVFTIPHAIAWAGTRLRTPLEPFLLVLAALGALAVVAKVRGRGAPAA